MPYWESLHIERFRQIENLHLEDLGTVNLLVGRNNCGKTAVLEALALACHPLSPSNWTRTASERNHEGLHLTVPELLTWLFPNSPVPRSAFHGSIAFAAQLQKSKRIYRNLDEPDLIQVRADIQRASKPRSAESGSNAGRSRAPKDSADAAELRVQVERKTSEGEVAKSDSVSLEFWGHETPIENVGTPILSHQYVTPNSYRSLNHLRTALSLTDDPSRKAQLLEILQRFAVNAEDCGFRSTEDPCSEIEVRYPKNSPIPLAMEGAGVRRALTMAAAATLARSGVLLIDEIETALHLESLAEVLPRLVQVCDESHTQLFVSTQSLEVVDAMLAIMGCADDDSDDLVAYRLPGRESNYPLKRYAGKTLYELRYEAGLDVR